MGIQRTAGRLDILSEIIHPIGRDITQPLGKQFCTVPVVASRRIGLKRISSHFFRCKR